MNYYERIIREGVMAADEYKKKETPIEDFEVTEEEIEDLESDALRIIKDLGNPFDPVIK
jgi:hypothetical protein